MGMVIAYHVVFSAYGFWLPNDPRGSNSTFVRAAHLLSFGMKGAATRQLVTEGIHPQGKFADERGRVPTPWAQELRKVFPFDPTQVREKIAYVNDNPGKDGLPAQRWSFVVPYPS